MDILPKRSLVSGNHWLHTGEIQTGLEHIDCYCFKVHVLQQCINRECCEEQVCHLIEQANTFKYGWQIYGQTDGQRGKQTNNREVIPVSPAYAGKIVSEIKTSVPSQWLRSSAATSIQVYMVHFVVK